MTAYLAVAIVAAVVTALVTPLVMRLARRIGAIDRPADPRKVHTQPVPTLGGLGMLAGFLAAMGLAALLPDFQQLFVTSEPVGLLIGVGVIALVGAIDDIRGLPPSIKVAGQIVASLGPILFGIQVVYAWIPGLDVVALSPDLGVVVTILAMLAMINAVNLIDGLDGLAAGVVAIAGGAFFAFAYLSDPAGLVGADVPTSAPLVAAIITGASLGFLVHNFHPAKTFMGDTGAMMLGLLLASAGVSHVGRSTAPSYTDFAGSIPLLVPALVLAIPFVDTAFAVARRAIRRQRITVADKEHLHHLLIAFGHSHRRAVLVLWYWSALLAFAVVAWSFVDTSQLIAAGSVAVLVGVGLTALGVRSSRKQPGDSDDAELSGWRAG